MGDITMISLIENVLEKMPEDWLTLTTHRLDIYNEKRAKVEFLEQFEILVSDVNLGSNSFAGGLSHLPTAFDYIRLGHPLSCILEWTIAKSVGVSSENVISFSSQTMPILAILRHNALINKETQILYKKELPTSFDPELLERVYGYKFSLINCEHFESIPFFDGSTIALSDFEDSWNQSPSSNVDFNVSLHPKFGSIILCAKEKQESYISEILHVRRRESVAMTPNDCLTALCKIIGKATPESPKSNYSNRELVLATIKDITNTSTDASLGSCGLSIQYAIMMGLIDHSYDSHHGKPIRFIVPPNCYGGTNDQARRVAACNVNVEIVDLPVDSGQNMVESLETILKNIALEDAVPYIIAEIPTNPRVEVPDLEKLRSVLTKVRKNSKGHDSISPVFILDQTFCPNMKFLGEGDILSTTKTISYVSGSKFPSGGLCTAGYCVVNENAKSLMNYIQKHLKLCDNEATAYQIQVLATQMPSMLKRINDAFINTKQFVDFIKEVLPEAKINFVSEELASIGFTPSVFSLDLPTSGKDESEKESYKRDLNLKLIGMMTKEIPASKHCVSYGQLKGCYWTIPATSTQGTTREGDKDYIVRVSISPDFDLDSHKEVFSRFCLEYIRG